MGVICFCDMSGVQVICRTCDTKDTWPIPEHFMDRPAFFEMVEDIVNVHSTEGLTLVDEDEPHVVKVPFMARVKTAVQVMRTKYVDLTED